MARKRYKPEEIVAKLRQVEVLTSPPDRQQEGVCDEPGRHLRLHRQGAEHAAVRQVDHCRNIEPTFIEPTFQI